MKKISSMISLLLVFIVGNFNTTSAIGNLRYGNFPGNILRNNPQNFSGITSGASKHTIKETSNGLINAIKNVGNFAKSLDTSVKNVSDAGKGLAKTAKETTKDMQSTLENFKEKKKRKSISPNTNTQELVNQRRRLSIQKQQIAIQHDQTITNIKNKMESIRIEKNQKLKSLDDKITRTNNDLERRRLELLRSQIAFQYDQNLAEYENKLIRAKENKKISLFNVDAQITATENEISERASMEEKQNRVEKARSQLLNQSQFGSLPKEELGEMAKQIRQAQWQDSSFPRPSKIWEKQTNSSIAKKAALIRQNR